jgi:glycosyltransferase involved in cell wall biosynthesis
MPGALMEALSCGLACVSFDCRTGPAELIVHDVNGLLIPPESVSALAAALNLLMTDAAKRADLGVRASKSVQRFDLETVLLQWEALMKPRRETQS